MYNSSIYNLRQLSTALNTFINRYDELQNHLHFLISSVDTNLHNGPSILPTLSIQSLDSHNSSNSALNIANSPENTETLTLDSIKPQNQTLDVQKTETLVIEEHSNKGLPGDTEIEALCATNSTRELRRYIMSNLSNVEKLRNEVPKALKRAQNPAQLVLSSIGRFFLQGIRAYDKDSPMVPARTVSVLILEFFLLMEEGKMVISEKMGGKMVISEKVEKERGKMVINEKVEKERGKMVINENYVGSKSDEKDGGKMVNKEKGKMVIKEKGKVVIKEKGKMVNKEKGRMVIKEKGRMVIDEKTRVEAEKNAIDWRKRLMSEGGLGRADEIDGRGLLLLIAGFGIPTVFTNSDIRDLLLSTNLAEIKGAIRRSTILLDRIPPIIEEMVKKKKDYKVADVIYAFGMENKFPPRPILASFLQESIETWNKAKKAAPGSLTAQRDASKRHLADLKSLMRRLKEHKLGISEILPNFPLTENIATLEKEILELNKKIEDQVNDKRRSEPKPMKRSDRREGSERREDRRDEKRARFPDPVPRPHNDRDYLDARIFSDRSTPIRVLDNAFPGNHYPSPYEMQRPLPEIRGSSGLLVDRAGPTINGDPYRLHEDAYLRERALAERVVNQRYPELSSFGGNGLLRQTTALDGFQGGLSNPLGIGSSSRISGSNSDLYQFADAVAERTLFGGSRDVPSVPRHSSYLY